MTAAGRQSRPAPGVEARDGGGDFARLVQQYIADLREQRDRVVVSLKDASPIYARAAIAIATADYDRDIAGQEAKLAYAPAFDALVTGIVDMYRCIERATGTRLCRDLVRWEWGVTRGGKAAVQTGLAVVGSSGFDVSIATREPTDDEGQLGRLLGATGRHMTTDEFLVFTDPSVDELFRWCKEAIDTWRDLKPCIDSDAEMAKLVKAVRSKEDEGGTADGPRFYT